VRTACGNLALSQGNHFPWLSSCSLASFRRPPISIKFLLSRLNEASSAASIFAAGGRSYDRPFGKEPAKERHRLPVDPVADLCRHSHWRDERPLPAAFIIPVFGYGVVISYRGEQPKRSSLTPALNSLDRTIWAAV
jgi:hypothetical protein